MSVMKRTKNWELLAVLLLFCFYVTVATAREEKGLFEKVVSRMLGGDDDSDEDYDPEDEMGDKTLKFKIDNSTYRFAYFGTASLKKGSPTVTSAMIVIHGHGNIELARKYYKKAVQGVKASNKTTDEVAVFAPHFFSRHALGESTNYLTWKGSSWIRGAAPESKRHQSLQSSYVVIDQMFYKLIDKDHFPHLKEVLMVGHSAGGQFVQRYALLTEIEQLLHNNGVGIRYVVANPSSYCYLTPERPRGDWRYAVPKESAIKDCPEYNGWKYGLDPPPPFLTESVAKVRKNYPTKKVTYLLGDEDNEEDEDLDTHCAAMFQGASRFERGENFYEYLQHLYGADVALNHSKIVVRGVGHSYAGMFLSPDSKRTIFGEGGHAAEKGIPSKHKTQADDHSRIQGRRAQSSQDTDRPRYSWEGGEEAYRKQIRSQL